MSHAHCSTAALLSAGVLIVGAAACAPARLQPAPDVTTYAQAVEPADTAPAPPRVQVRRLRSSPDAEVLAWAPEDPAFGLRGSLDPRGTLIRDHRVYVSAYLEPAPRRFDAAKLSSWPLIMAGSRGDPYACYFGECTPPRSFEARIPDEVLRATRDSVVIRFQSADGHELIVPLRPDVVDAYLATIDSLQAALRRPS